MLNNNRGFRFFKTIVSHAKSHLEAMKCDHIALDHWCEHRWTEIEVQLNDLSRHSQVNAFISDYATSLGKSLVQLFESNSWDVLSEIPMDYAEELLLQARSYAMMNREISPSCCPDDDGESLYPAASHSNYSMAA